MNRHDYYTAYNAQRRTSAAPQTPAQRLAERDHPYAPAVYRWYEIVTVDPRYPGTLDIMGDRSLVPTKEAKATIGFKADVLCAIVQGGETFWVVDASRYYPRTTEPFNDQWQPRYLVPSPRAGAPDINLGLQGLAVVQPRVVLSDQPMLGVQRLAFDREDPTARTHAAVGASVPAARDHFDLPQGYPDRGFMVVLNNDGNTDREYPAITVINQSGAQTEVLLPANRLQQLIGRIVIEFAPNNE